MDNERQAVKWIQGTVLGLLLLLIFSMGLLFTSRTTDTNLFKELSMIFIIPIGFFLFGAQYIIQNRLELTRSKMNLPVLIFLGLSTLSFLIHPSTMFFSKFTFIKYVLFVFTFFLLSNLVQKKWQLETLFYTLIIIAFLCAVYGLMQKAPGAFKWLGFTDSWSAVRQAEKLGNWFPILIRWAGMKRIPSTFGNPNFFAAYIVLMAPLALTMIFTRKRWGGIVLPVITSLILILCIIFTQTRGGWMGFGVGIVVYLVLFIFFVERDRLARNMVFWIVLVAFILAGAGYLTKNKIVSRRLTTTARDIQTGGGTVGSRSAFYEGSWYMFTDKPVLGQGVGTFQIKFPSFRPNDYRRRHVSHNTRHSHCEYLQLLSEMGVPGLLSFLFVVMASIRVAWGILTTRSNRDYLIVCGGILIAFLGFLGYNIQKLQALGTVIVMAIGGAIILGGILKTVLTQTYDSSNRYYKHVTLGLLASIIGILVHNLVSVNLRWVEAAFFLWFCFGLLAAVNRLAQQTDSETENPATCVHVIPQKTLIPVSVMYAILAIGVTVPFIYTYVNYYKSELNRARGVTLLERARNYTQAKEAFERSIHYYPQNLSSLYKVAFVYGVVDNDLQKAYDTYTEIIKYAPHYSEIHFNLTSNCMSIAAEASRKKDSKRAEEFIKKAEEQGKLAVKIQNSAKNNMLLARVYMRTGEQEKAVQFYQKAKEMMLLEKQAHQGDSKKAQLVLEWVSYLMQQKKFDEAHKELSEIYEEYKQDLAIITAPALKKMQATTAFFGETAAAGALVQTFSDEFSKQHQRLQSEYPGIIEIRLRLADLYRMRRNTRQAEAIVNSLITEYPDNGMIYYYLGKQHYYENKKFKARAEFEKALQLDSKGRWAEDARKLLKRINDEI